MIRVEILQSDTYFQREKACNRVVGELIEIIFRKESLKRKMLFSILGGIIKSAYDKERYAYSKENLLANELTPIFNSEEDMIKKIIKLLDQIYEFEQNTLDKARGLFLERIVYRMCKIRYNTQSAQSKIGASVKINGLHIKNKNYKSFDFAGWDSSKKLGEFYESKMSPERFDEDHIDLYIKLSNAIKKNQGHALYGFVSFENKKTIKNRIKHLSKYDDLAKILTIFGMDNILELENIRLCA